MTAENKKVAIIFHSGSGSTRTIAEVFEEKLARYYDVDMLPASLDFDYQRLSSYDFLIFGFPTYHCQPSASIAELVDRLPGENMPPYAFIFTTYGLYIGNSLRIMAKKLLAGNITTVGYTKIRGPASDGVLLFSSSISFMFRYQKSARRKIQKSISGIRRAIDEKNPRLKMPIYKWYAPANDPLIDWGERTYKKKYRDHMYTLEDRCKNCNLCVDQCIRHCWTKGDEHPIFNPAICEFCLKCVHNCPNKAVAFSEKMKDKPRLNKNFYKKLKDQL